MLLPLLLGCLGQGYSSANQISDPVGSDIPPGLPVRDVCGKVTNQYMPDTSAYYILQPGDDSWNTVARRFRPITRDGSPREPIAPEALIAANYILYQDLEKDPERFYSVWFKEGNPVYLPKGITCEDYETKNSAAEHPVAELRPASPYRYNR